MDRERQEVKQAFREARQFLIDHFDHSEWRTLSLQKLHEAEWWALYALEMPH